MDVPYSKPNTEQIMAWKKRWNVSDIPSGSLDRPAITGKYADIVVHIDNSRRLVFGRETSYRPWLQTPSGRFPFKQIVAYKPDPMCLSSYVRIIKNESGGVLIHCCG